MPHRRKEMTRCREDLNLYDVSYDEDIDREVDEVIEKLNNSKRPVILAGNGIRLSGGIDELKKLIELLNIPILTTWNGIDLIPSDSKLFFGRPGGLGNRYANFIQQNSDLFISIGARLNLLQTGYNFEGFANKAVQYTIVSTGDTETAKASVSLDGVVTIPEGYNVTQTSDDPVPQITVTATSIYDSSKSDEMSILVV